jgi:hypothetical protein
MFFFDFSIVVQYDNNDESNSNDTVSTANSRINRVLYTEPRPGETESRIRIIKKSSNDRIEEKRKNTYGKFNKDVNGKLIMLSIYTHFSQLSYLRCTTSIENFHRIF